MGGRGKTPPVRLRRHRADPFIAQCPVDDRGNWRARRPLLMSQWPHWSPWSGLSNAKARGAAIVDCNGSVREPQRCPGGPSLLLLGSRRSLSSVPPLIFPGASTRPYHLTSIVAGRRGAGPLLTISNNLRSRPMAQRCQRLKWVTQSFQNRSKSENKCTD